MVHERERRIAGALSWCKQEVMGRSAQVVEQWL